MSQLDELSNVVEDRAIELVESLLQRALAVAAGVARQRPFLDSDDLRNKKRVELLGLGEAERINLFREHPELAPDSPLTMTGASQSEQGRLSLTSETSEYRTQLTNLNTKYRSKIGFPFITALVLHQDLQSVFAEFESRLVLDRSEEIENAIGQIVAASPTRVQAAFARDGAETPMGVAASA